MEFNVTVKQTVSQERIEDLLCSAFEGGISYWARFGEVVADGDDASYAFQIPARGGVIRLEDSTGEGWPESDGILDHGRLAKGLQVMADKYPQHWSDFVAQGEDVWTGDVFVQCCLFGEVVFG